MSRPIESITFERIHLERLSAGDGTEVIQVRLPKTMKWILSPQAGWDGLEFVYLLSGELNVLYADHTDVLRPGDHLGHCPVSEVMTFLAVTDATFLYVSSRPVFEAYARDRGELRDLAMAIEEKDGYTHDHCRRIAAKARVVGEKLGLTPEQMLHLNLGSFLHDVGKVRMPPAILGKRGPLSPDEWSMVKQHPTFGAEILKETGLPGLVSAAPIVEQHHERWDGAGYPHGLKGDQILITAAIVTLVDSFDAMTTDRPYRRGMTHEQAIAEILRCRGTQFRPDVVDAFLAVLPDMKSRGGLCS